MIDYSDIWELAPTDPFMQQIRALYFNATGHYGSDKEIKVWYIGKEVADTFYPITYKETPSA